MNKRSFLTLIFTATLTLSLSGCTKVGSEAWCKKMKETQKADWMANEAADYAKHCIFK